MFLYRNLSALLGRPVAVCGSRWAGVPVEGMRQQNPLKYPNCLPWPPFHLNTTTHARCALTARAPAPPIPRRCFQTSYMFDQILAAFYACTRPLAFSHTHGHSESTRQRASKRVLLVGILRTVHSCWYRLLVFPLLSGPFTRRPLASIYMFCEKWQRRAALRPPAWIASTVWTALGR